MRVRVLIEMDDGGRGIRAVNVLDSAMHKYNDKLRRADPPAEIDFEVLGVVPSEQAAVGCACAGALNHKWGCQGSSDAQETVRRLKDSGVGAYTILAAVSKVYDMEAKNRG